MSPDINTIPAYQLDVWKGQWGLPSIDIDCLQILAYTKFAKIPLEINYTNNPFRSPGGRLPVLRHEKGTEDSMIKILQLFHENNYSPDSGLNAKQGTGVIAYGRMLEEKILPALQFIWWIDKRNFREVIRPWYAKAIPFILNYYYLSEYRKRAEAMMEALYPYEEDLINIETNVYAEAQKCLNILSERLGESDYFFGSYPTTLDAIVYSYLAPILKIPLPNAALRNHLEACQNLVKFVTRISVKYFERESKLFESKKITEETRTTEADPDNDFPHKTRNKIIAGTFATVAMLTYAISTGILEVSTKDDDMDKESSDYTLENQDFYSDESLEE